MLYYLKYLLFNYMEYFCIKRYGRAMSQKIYLIDYERSLKKNGMEPYWKFTMMGNSDQCYKLFFSPNIITCDCLDFEENLGKKSLCKHLFYIFGFVAKFSFAEIQANDFAVMRNKLFHMFDGLFNNKTIHGRGKEDCVICLQTLQQNCHKCERCSQLIHLECLRLWLSRNATCPFCRYNTYLSPVQVPQLETYVEPKPFFFDEPLSDYPPFLN